ncbi:MAG: hypothetical protein ACYC53_12595 [Bacillota bacterium]
MAALAARRHMVSPAALRCRKEFAKPREKIVAGSGYASPTAAARPGVKAILVLAAMGYSFALFRQDYVNLKSAWQMGGPTKTTSGRADATAHPHRLWTIRFGGSVEALPLPSGHVAVRNRGSENSSLYVVNTKGKIIWRYQPIDGSVDSAVEVVAGLDSQGRVVVAAASGKVAASRTCQTHRGVRS